MQHISLKPFKALLGWGEQAIIAKKCNLTLRRVNANLNDKVDNHNIKVIQYIMQEVAPRASLMSPTGGPQGGKAPSKKLFTTKPSLNMQTITAQPIQPSNIKQSCEKYSSPQSASRLLPFLQSMWYRLNLTSLKQPIKFIKQLQKQPSKQAAASQDVADILLACQKAAKVNSRFIIGLSVMGMSFLSLGVHSLFSTSYTPIPQYAKELVLNGNPLPKEIPYYINTHDLIATIDEHVSFILFIVAVMVWIWPVTHSIKYLRSCFVIPIGFEATRILWLIFCRSDYEVNSIPTFQYFIIGGLFGLVVNLCFRYWIYRKFHPHDRIIAAIKQLKVLIKSSSDKTLVDAFEKSVEEYKLFDTKY